MHTSAIWAVLITAVSGAASDVTFPYDGTSDLTPSCRIDELVLADLRRLDIRPAKVCSDAVFLRRVYLDVIGTLPTAQEAREFLLDKTPNKRSALIDRLLERDEFADFWAMRWSDLLRVKAEFPINLWPNAAQAYHRWIRSSIRENLPYDQFARRLLTSNGSNFRVGQVNFFRAAQNKTPEGIAQSVALTFMGVRADKWPKERLDGMAAFFTQVSFRSTGEWKEEIVSFDPTVALTVAPRFPDGSLAKIEPGRDPRVALADWLLREDNPWFGRCIANRIWYWLLGRGIVHEPDDMVEENAPSNPALLDYLAQEVRRARFDLKQLYRLILNSQTYQLSCVGGGDSPEAVAHFARYPLRRLDAEVLIDALNQITGTTEQYSSPIPEPFTYIPEGQRSIALPDGSITSPFLEMFGRPPRDTGLAQERSNRPSADQRLHLLNSSHIQRKIETSPKLQAVFQIALPADSRAGKAGKNRRNKPVPDDPQRSLDAIKELYLTVLSRFPTEQELVTIRKYFQSSTVRREAANDLAWALVNSAEFMYRH